MGFWKKVNDELEYKGISRKELSIETGIPVQTINRAIERDSKIYVEDALKIAKFFNKEVEYFIDNPILLNSEKNTQKAKQSEELKQNLALFHKYHDLITNCESLPEYQQNSVYQLAKSLAEATPEYFSSK